MGAGSSKLAGNPLGRQAVKTGLKHFKEEADAMWKMAQESSEQGHKAAIQRAIENNKKDKESFKDLFREESCVDKANRDLADLYAPFGNNRADSIAAQKNDQVRSK